MSPAELGRKRREGERRKGREERKEEKERKGGREKKREGEEEGGRRRGREKKREGEEEGGRRRGREKKREGEEEGGRKGREKKREGEKGGRRRGRDKGRKEGGRRGVARIKRKDLINLTWLASHWNVRVLSDLLSRQKSTNCPYCNGEVYTTYLLRFMPCASMEGGLVAAREGRAWWIARGVTLAGLSAGDPRVRLGRGGGPLVGVEEGEKGKLAGSS